MSMVNWIFGKGVSPAIKEYEEFLSEAVGKENLHRIRKVQNEEINRFSIYGTALEDHQTYAALFKSLNPSYVWLQDQSFQCGQSLLGRIKEQGGDEEVDLCLMWAEAPGKIYCAYPDEEGTWLLERFFPTQSSCDNHSGVTELINLDQLKGHVLKHAEKKHDLRLWSEGQPVLADPAANLEFKPLLQKLRQMQEVRSEIKQNEAVFEKLNPGKKNRQKRQELTNRISSQREKLLKLRNDYSQTLVELKLSATKEDPTGLMQRDAFFDVSSRMADLKKEIHRLKQNPQISKKIIAQKNEQLKQLEKEYCQTFDQLI